jgi:hypothetical protein
MIVLVDAGYGVVLWGAGVSLWARIAGAIGRARDTCVAQPASKDTGSGSYRAWRQLGLRGSPVPPEPRSTMTPCAGSDRHDVWATSVWVGF